MGHGNLGKLLEYIKGFPDIGCTAHRPTTMTLKDSESRVQVGVRVRPLTGREIQQRGQNVLSTTSTSVRLGERQFTYDAVFDADASQGELYSSVAPPLLSKFVGGYNATVR